VTYEKQKAAISRSLVIGVTVGDLDRIELKTEDIELIAAWLAGKGFGEL